MRNGRPKHTADHEDIASQIYINLVQWWARNHLK